MYFSPRLKDFEKDQDDEYPVSLKFKYLVSGKKHYTLLNDENVIVSFGDFLKTHRG